jgi:hypothetical protein
MTTLQYEDLREARRQIADVEDPKAQEALFTLLGLVHQLEEQIRTMKQTCDYREWHGA